MSIDDILQNVNFFNDIYFSRFYPIRIFVPIVISGERWERTLRDIQVKSGRCAVKQCLAYRYGIGVLEFRRTRLRAGQPENAPSIICAILSRTVISVSAVHPSNAPPFMAMTALPSNERGSMSEVRDRAASLVPAMASPAPYSSYINISPSVSSPVTGAVGSGRAGSGGSSTVTPFVLPHSPEYIRGKTRRVHSDTAVIEVEVSIIEISAPHQAVGRVGNDRKGQLFGKNA